MIARLIRWSARNVLLILIATAGLVGGGLFAVGRLSLDAIPDLSDTQVIVYTEMPGQAPQVVEDQVTFPLTTAMLAVPKSRAVRGFSFFGVSFVYVIFEDGTDIYWARSRVLEYLNSGAQKLPANVKPTLGPDATGVGWVYQYVVVGADRTLAELRSLQDWYIRFGLAKAPGIAEVASVGGFVRQYNVVVDPLKLRSYGVPLSRVVEAIRASNRETGGRVVELAEAEFMVRGRGYLTGTADLEQIVLKADGPAPVLMRDVARIELGPDERRGLSELNGEGEAVGGIALQRFGQNALDVIDGVKARLREIAGGLPEGVRIETVYDRSELIHRAIETLKSTLIEECLVVAAVCMIFLLHVRSALVAIVTLPVGVLMAFIAMHFLGIGSNIMSLGGIAIAIGAMVDAAIVMIENAHKHLERLEPGQSRNEAIIKAAVEVGPALFFSLLVITVSFLPIFALEEQEGRLFKPLAWTKSLAMAASAMLSVTLVPALMMLFVRGRILPERRNPVNRALIWLYRPAIRLVLRAHMLTLGLAVAALAVTAWPAMRLGAEFMPSLDEGTLFYMPVTLPGLSVTKSAELLQTQNKIIKSFPEVTSVFGKAGRAATATDPAPLEMFETVINLKPKAEWRSGMTIDKLIAEMDRALQFPGVANAWTMPIKNRIDMLATGIRTPVGIKVFGNDLTEIETIARQIEAVVKTVPGTTSAYAERITGGYYLDIEPDRLALARYGLAVGDLLEVISVALGGEVITTTVEGRERFDVAIRYPRELRSDPQAIATQVLVPAMGGTMIPLGQLAQVKLMQGPPSIRTENALLSAYI
ncbi:efflux RND transporter permease subunit, partial [Reyranella sp.]|uniref:efflux RND transporter permease subunit n=1 Tax=Reyranella sp. TaxID=1929291 RepID=UPI002731F6D9